MSTGREEPFGAPTTETPEKLEKKLGWKVKQGGSQLFNFGKSGGYNVSNPQNVGNSTPETYESAMLQIYREAHRAGISPLVTVTKNPTRNRELVRLDLITGDLLQKAGYQIFDYHQAVLFKSHDETSVNLDMGVDKKISHKDRIGFFKQLDLRKGGIAASWEDILFAR